jgi:hypothetical protein
VAGNEQGDEPRALVGEEPQGEPPPPPLPAAWQGRWDRICESERELAAALGAVRLCLPQALNGGAMCYLFSQGQRKSVASPRSEPALNLVCIVYTLQYLPVGTCTS